MTRVNSSDALPQQFKCHLLPDMASPPDPASGVSPGWDKWKRLWTEQETSSCLWKRDFPGESWAQHHPMEMFSSFLFPLCLDHISNLPNSPFALWWGWRHQTHAGECLKHNNAVGKQVLSVFLAIFPKEHFAATLSNFPVLCRFLAPPVSASPGLWWELSMKKSRRVWKASSIQACFPASGQGQVLFGRSSVSKVNYRWN